MECFVFLLIGGGHCLSSLIGFQPHNRIFELNIDVRYDSDEGIDSHAIFSDEIVSNDFDCEMYRQAIEWSIEFCDGIPLTNNACPYLPAKGNFVDHFQFTCQMALAEQLNVGHFVTQMGSSTNVWDKVRIRNNLNQGQRLKYCYLHWNGKGITGDLREFSQAVSPCMITVHSDPAYEQNRGKFARSIVDKAFDAFGIKWFLNYGSVLYTFEMDELYSKYQMDAFKTEYQQLGFMDIRRQLEEKGYGVSMQSIQKTFFQLVDRELHRDQQLLKCRNEYTPGMHYVSTFLLIPPWDTSFHSEVSYKCSMQDWIYHHFIWKGTDDESLDVRVGQSQFTLGVCAPRSCFSDYSHPSSTYGYLLLPKIPLLEHLMDIAKTQRSYDLLENHLREILETHEFLSEERIIPYNQTKQLSIAILGFPKCGTSQIAHNLGNHPDIAIYPKRRSEEIDAFTSGLMYQSTFDEIMGSPGEADVSNPNLKVGVKWSLGIYHPEDVFAARVYGLKTIISIRHPLLLYESVSSYTRWGNETQSDYWSDIEGRTKMSEILAYAISIFDAADLMIVSLENFARSPAETYSAIFKFLQVKHVPVEKSGLMNVNICKTNQLSGCAASCNESAMQERAEQYEDEARKLEVLAAVYSHGIDTIYGLHSDKHFKFCKKEMCTGIKRSILYKLRKEVGEWLVCSLDERMLDTNANFMDVCDVDISLQPMECSDKVMVTVPEWVFPSLPSWFLQLLKA